MENQFTWGAPVIISKNAPPNFHPGEFASVCSFYKNISEESAGEWIYTVELENGFSIQVPEYYLDRDTSIVDGMELSKYSNYFINGSVLEIKIDVNLLEIQMKSASVDQLIPNNVPILSDDGCFKGRLIIPQIEAVIIHNSSYSIGAQEKGIILSFQISEQSLKLLVEWHQNKTTLLEVKAGQIWWEQRA